MLEMFCKIRQIRQKSQLGDLCNWVINCQGWNQYNLTVNNKCNTLFIEETAGKSAVKH